MSTAAMHVAQSRAGDPDRSGASGGLSERDARVLDFERAWWEYAGNKDEGIREQFSMSATRYYQLLNSLLDDPAALAHDPLLVKRLRRERERRQRARSARRLSER